MPKTAASGCPDSRSRLWAVMHYGVGRLWVLEEQLGLERVLQRAGREDVLALPTSSGAFRRASSWPLQALTGARMGAAGQRQLVGVGVVQVRVDLGRGLGDEGPGNAEMKLLREADELATPVVRALLDWTRAHGDQPWLSPGHEQPPPEGEAWLEDESGSRLRSYPFRRDHRVVLLEQEHAARIGDLQQLSNDTLEGTAEPSVAALLLADARHAIWPEWDLDP